MSTPSSSRQTGLLRGKIGWVGIVFFVVAAAAPLTVVFGSMPAAIAYGGIGIPGAVLIAGVVLLLFSFGLTAMAKYVSNTGAFYAYASKGLGKPVGIGVALAASFSYAVLSIAFYGLLGFFGNVTANEVFGVDIPWWVFSAIAIAGVVLLSTRKVDVGAKVLGVILTLEILIVAVLMIVIIGQGGSGEFSFAPFALDNVVFAAGAGILLVFAFGAFLGFEATVVYSEEAKDPDRNIPIATYVAVIFLALFYALAFAVIIYGFGVAGTLDISGSEDAPFLTLIATTVWLGDLGVAAMLILVVTSFFACLMAFHNATSRYLFSLGREGLLPKSLATTNKHGAPWRASVVLIVLATLVIIYTAIAGLDPYFGMAIFVYSIGVAGLVMVQAFAAYSIVGFFLKDRRGHSLLRSVIAPGLGAIGLTIAWYLIATNMYVLSEVKGAINLLFVLPAPILLVGGIIYGVILKSKDTATYTKLLTHTPSE